MDNTFLGYEDPRPSGATGLCRLLTRHPREADLARRRFRPGPARTSLEQAEKAHLFGFNAILADELDLIEDLPRELRGSGYEGAAAACATLDLLTLSGDRRLHALLIGPAADHPQAVYLGAGRACARLRVPPMWGLRGPHPLRRWFAVDGYGFQRALSQADRLVGERCAPALHTRSQQAIFDLGLGRLLWFHDCAFAEDVAARVAGFPVGRRPDLWSGVAYAATYVGGADDEELERLAAHATSGGFRANLAQGAAFAAATMLQAGHVPDRAVQAVRTLAGADPDEAASWTARALATLDLDPHDHQEFLAWLAHTRRVWARRDR
ncbi:DUF1702 family protein [Nonomuraea sp. NPDC046570]|uniref:DUF1702 family protein n=1 Tax=Nonomuraea sp. NPDC046570 TaxID=3155255 RepID=UPI0033E56480